jgi:exonuclease III
MANTVNDLCNHINTTYLNFCNNGNVDISDHHPVETTLDGMKILSFNIAGGGISYFHQRPQQEDRDKIPIRIKHICDFIKHANYDIICLQEVTNAINDSILYEELKGIYTRYQNAELPGPGNHYNVIFVKTIMVNANDVRGSICVGTQTGITERCNTLEFTFNGIYYHVINCKFSNNDLQIINLLERVAWHVNFHYYNYNKTTFIIAGDFNINTQSTQNVRSAAFAFKQYLNSIGVNDSTMTVPYRQHNDYIFTTTLADNALSHASRTYANIMHQQQLAVRKLQAASCPTDVANLGMQVLQGHASSGNINGHIPVDTHNMFYAKYLKYKQKYLELKNQHMG